MGVEKTTLDELRIDRTVRKEKRGVGWVWLVVLLVIVLAAAGLWWFKQPSAAALQLMVLREATSSGQKTLLNASGYVVARREATVSSKVTGKVMEVLIEEGVRVKEGQVLARLDSSNVKTSLDLAEAQLASAQSALAEIQVRLHAAEVELRRVTGLATNHVASESDLDRAAAEADSLRARLEQQKTEISVAERQQALWQQQMDDTVIRAPFAGIVVSKNAQPGEMISPISAGGGFTRTGICTIVDMDSLEIEIDVSESYINRVRPGQPVEATLDAYPEWKIPCKVKAIIPTADRQKATVKVRVAFDSLDPRILPQMGVKVAFQSVSGAGLASGAATGFRIPKTAVRSQDGRTIVFLVQNGRAERRAVRVTDGGNDEVLVGAGLASGDKLVVQPPEQMQEGDRVGEKR
jgi:RND family efflux transporter MFP subunit